MEDRYLICLGGGDIKEKTTLKIDEYIATLVKKKCGDKRPRGMFIGTASHDFMPYFNSFRKTYTPHFDIKADCVLLVYGEMNEEKIKNKFEIADFIYVGGGDTIFMLEKWKETGVDKLILDAYKRGVILCGLSAGAICWFETMFTDSLSKNGDEKYSFYEGLGLVKGVCSPHFELRREEFYERFKDMPQDFAYCLEANSALVFKNEELIGSLSSGGKATILTKKDGQMSEFEPERLN